MKLIKNIWIFISTLQAPLLRGLFSFNRTTYPWRLVPDWRSETVPHWWEAMKSFPRVSLYYDYSFHVFLSGLATGQRSLFGVSRTSPIYPLVTSLTLRIIWLFGSGYRFFSSEFYRPFPLPEHTDDFYLPVDKGFFDVFSPLAVISRIIHLCNFIVWGTSELHYRLNPTFYLYNQARDLGRLPYPGRTFVNLEEDEGYWLEYDRRTSASFRSEDEYFLWLTFYYRSWQGRLHNLLRLLFYVLLLLPLTVFHVFFRTPLWYICYWWNKFQVGWSKIELIELAPSTPRNYTRGLITPFAVYWDAFIAHAGLLKHVGLFRSGWWLQMRNLYQWRLRPRQGLFWWVKLCLGLSFSLFSYLPRLLYNRVSLFRFKPYHLAYGSAGRVVFRWVRFRILSRASSSHIIPSAPQFQRVKRLVPTLVSITKRSSFHATLAGLAFKTATRPGYHVDADFSESSEKARLGSIRLYSRGVLLQVFTHFGEFPIVHLRLARFKLFAYRYILNGASIARSFLTKLYSLTFPRLAHFGRFFLYGLLHVFGINPSLARNLRPGLFPQLIRRLLRYVGRRLLAIGLSVRSAWFGFTLRVSVALRSLPQIFPTAAGDIFSPLFSILRSVRKATFNYQETYLAKKVFSIQHRYGLYDSPVLYDDDEVEAYTQSYSEWTRDPVAAETEVGSSFDSFDGAYPVAELYSPGDLDEDSEGGDASSVDYYLHASHSSPLIDRSISSDFFEDDMHQEEAGFGFWLWSEVLFYSGIHSWISRWPATSIYEPEQHFYLNDKKTEDVWAFEAHNQYHPIGPGINLGPDRGDTELTAAAFTKLMRFSSKYKQQMNSKVAELPRSSLQHQLDVIRRTLGIGSYTNSLFPKLKPKHWLELTLFVDGITTGNLTSAPDANIFLSRSEVKRIWDRFADRAARSPDLIFQRLTSAPQLPSVFHDYITYSTNPTHPTSEGLDVLCRWLFGEEFRTVAAYRVVRSFMASVGVSVNEVRLRFLGDTRALRLVYLYCSGLLPARNFDAEFSRLQLSPQTVYAIASYLRRLAIDDFDTLRRLAFALPETASFFSLFCLSAASPSRATPRPPSHYQLAYYLEGISSPFGTKLNSLKTMLGGLSGWQYEKREFTTRRGRQSRYQTNLLPTRHPYNVLPFLFISDFFYTLFSSAADPEHRYLKYKDEAEVLEYMYGEEDFDSLDQGYGKSFYDATNRPSYFLNKRRPIADVHVMEGQIPEPLWVEKHEDFGPIIDPELHKVLELERALRFNHSFGRSDVLFGKKIFRRIVRRLGFYKRVYRFTWRMQRRTTHAPGTDVNELHTSAAVSPFLRFFTEVQAANAVFSQFNPPQFTKAMNFVVNQGVPFEDAESDLMDLYDEPISAVFQTYELTETAEDTWLSEYAAPYDVGVLGQLHEEDEDNYAHEYNSGPEYLESMTNYYETGDTEGEHYSESDIIGTLYGDAQIDQMPRMSHTESSNFFESSLNGYRVDTLDEEEWQQDRFELAMGVSIPLARLFLGGLPTRGSFPATDPRLFLGRMETPGEETNLHYAHVFARAKESSLTTALVPVSEPIASSGVFFPLVKALGVVFLRIALYIYLLLRDLIYAHWMQAYSDQSTVRVARLHASVLAHYYQWQDVYANKYYFRHFASALQSWTTDFEAYLDRETQLEQYKFFASNKTFTLVEANKFARPFTRFFQMFPFRSFLFGPDGYHLENPNSKEFPYRVPFYILYWYRRYHQRHLPDAFHEVSDREIFKLDSHPSGWIREPLLDDERHFWPPTQVEKWTLYERTRFSGFFDLPNSGDQTPFDWTFSRRSSSPFGGWFSTLKRLNRAPRYWGGDPRLDRSTLVKPEDRSELFDPFPFESDPPIFTTLLDLTGGNPDVFSERRPLTSADIFDSALEAVGFSDAEDASLFSYVTEVDLSSHVDEFQDRLQILWIAFWDFANVLIDYTTYGVGLFFRTYVWLPFHYWVVYSERFWLECTLRFGLWINIVRYLLTGTLFLGLYIYAFFAIPALSYYFFADNLTTGGLLMLNAFFSFALLLFLPYLFFNPVYRYYQSLWTFERLSILVGVFFIYFEHVFFGYRPPGARLAAIGDFPASADEPFWRELNLDYYAATGNGGYDHVERSNRFYSPWNRRAVWRVYDIVAYGKDDVFGLWPYRQYYMKSTHPEKVLQAYNKDEYWNRYLYFMHTDWALQGRLLPDLTAAYHFLKAEYMPFQTDFFTGIRAMRLIPGTDQIKDGSKEFYINVMGLPDEQKYEMAGDEMDSAEYINQFIEYAEGQGPSAYARAEFNYYLHGQKVLPFHRYPVSPIHGVNNLFGEARTNMGVIAPYEFRPTSFVHDPFHNRGNFLEFPDYGYNVPGLSARDRNREIRVPDFGDLLIDVIEEEQEAWMVDGPLLHALIDLFGEEDLDSLDLEDEDVDLLFFYDPEVDGDLHVLMPQAHYMRPSRVETFDEINLSIYDLDPTIDEPIVRTTEDVQRVGSAVADLEVQLELLTDSEAEEALPYESITVEYPGMDYEPGDTWDAFQEFFYFPDITLYEGDQCTPVTDIDEAIFPAEEVLTTRLDQPPLLYDRYFDTYLAGDWSYRRDLLNRAYTITSQSDPAILSQYYHFIRANARTSHFMDYYAKNLRDYLLYFKPHSAYAFADVYGPDQRLRLVAHWLNKKNRWQNLMRKNWSNMRNFDYRAYNPDQSMENFLDKSAPYKNSYRWPPPPELGRSLYKALRKKGSEYWTLHDFTDLPLIALGEELSWWLGSQSRDLKGFQAPRTVATAVDSITRWAQLASQGKRFSDFHFHRLMVPASYPDERIRRSLAFDASLYPTVSTATEQSILDPFHRTLQDSYPELKEVFALTSATAIPNYLTNYGYGYRYISTDPIITDPLDLYDYDEGQPLYTFPSTVDRYGTIYHSFVFDVDEVYAPIYEDPEEFIHFVTYPDLDDDYLAAIDRYEAGFDTYFDPTLPQVVLGPYWGVDFDRDVDLIKQSAGIYPDIESRLPPKPISMEEELDEGVAEDSDVLPPRPALSPYVHDGSVAWKEHWFKKELKDAPRPYRHYIFDLYPLRTGGVLDRQDLSAYRRVRRLRQKAPNTQRPEAGLFENLRGFEVQFRHKRKPMEEEPFPVVMHPPFDFFYRRYRRPDMVLYPLRADRIMAIADYNRVHSLTSVYFSEYRKLLPLDPRSLFRGVVPDPGEQLDLEKPIENLGIFFRDSARLVQPYAGLKSLANSYDDLTDPEDFGIPLPEGPDPSFMTAQDVITALELARARRDEHLEGVSANTSFSWLYDTTSLTTDLLYEFVIPTEEDEADEFQILETVDPEFDDYLTELELADQEEDKDVISIYQRILGDDLTKFQPVRW